MRAPIPTTSTWRCRISMRATSGSRLAPDATIRKAIETQPWGERSFYCADPFGNKLCFVDDQTLFTAGLI